jgi:teichuronic acid biosynthesis glycosyltransferase TuaG
MNNLVSIITPSFNSSKYIKETVDSVLSQTYEDWELIIVDDGSKDSSANIIQDLTNTDTRIKGFYFDKNRGASEARNYAISKAQGKYLAFLDSDDLWNTHKLEKQLSFMQKNKIGFSFTSYQPFSNTTFQSVIKAPKVITYNQLLKNTIIGCLTVIIDTEIVKKVNFPSYKTSQDFAAWLLILRDEHCAYGFNENLASYRVLDGSNSSNKFNVIRGVWRVYRDSEKLSAIKSSWCLINYIFNALLKRI